MIKYKQRLSEEERIAESAKLQQRHPDLIPIIIEKHPKSTLPDPDKSKFLSPQHLKTSDFMNKIRSKLNLTKEQALMAFIDGAHIMPVDRRMCEVYDQYKSSDNFLYVIYSEQESFGSNQDKYLD